MAISTDLNQKLINEVFALYSDAEAKMLAKVASRIKRGITEQGYYEERAQQLTATRKDLGSTMKSAALVAKAKMSKGILSSYTKGLRSAELDHGIPSTVFTYKIPYHVQRAVLEANNLIDGTSVQILRDSLDVYRQIVSDVSLNALVGVETRQAVAQDALNRLAARGITGFVDKAGRKWEMASYLEMAVRTTTAHAALQGHIDRQADMGNDLVMVSSIGTTCPICARWQGKVLSISGKDSKYTALQDARAEGLFHPNCKHTVTAYFPEMEELESELVDHRHERFNDALLYRATQKQRSIERHIRQWKRVEAVAMDPAAKARANIKIRHWQAEQRKLVELYNLKRKYARENISSRVGISSRGAIDSIVKPFKYEAPPKHKIKSVKKFDKKPPTPVAVLKPEGKIFPGEAKTFEDIRAGSVLDDFKDAKIREVLIDMELDAVPNSFIEYRGKTTNKLFGITAIDTSSPSMLKARFLDNDELADSKFNAFREAAKVAMDAGKDLEFSSPNRLLVTKVQEFFEVEDFRTFGGKLWIPKGALEEIVVTGKYTGAFLKAAEPMQSLGWKFRKKGEPKPFDISQIPTLKHLDLTIKEFMKDSRYKDIGNKDELKMILQTVVNNANTYSRVPDTKILTKIFDDNKFKNQFETNTSKGSLNQSSRKEASKNLFGTDTKTTDITQYEFYGYLGEKDVLKDMKANRGMNHYGDIVVKFKSDVRRRTTFTMDDSLGPGMSGSYVASSLEKVEVVNVRRYAAEDLTMKELKSQHKISNVSEVTPGMVCNTSSISYMEAQYHGGLTLDDVDEITFTSGHKPTTKIKEIAKKMGIRLREIVGGAMQEILS